MEYTPFSLLLDVGMISLLMAVGVLLRRWVPLFQKLLIPSPIVAGLLGLALGPEGLGLLGFSEKTGDYTTILIAVVFAAMPFTMVFDRQVRAGARTMWSFSTGMFMAQWGIFILLGAWLFAPVFGTEDWFGMMLPTGFVGGFGTAAAVGGALDETGAVGASSLGFASATVGTFAAIIGGLIFANWGFRTGRVATMPATLPKEMTTGIIDRLDERPSIGRATTNPSSVEALGLHAGLLAVVVTGAYLLNEGIKSLFPAVSIPLFALSFVVGIVVMLLLRVTGAERVIDRDTVGAISGGSTDFLIAFGIASIAPAAIADYWLPLLVLFALGIAFCTVFFFLASPVYFGAGWLERGIFGWGWATAAVATGIALLKIVDPKLKSGTLSEYGVAYIGFAPFEIGMTILAPIGVIAGATLPLGLAATVVAALILAAPFVFRWLPGRRRESAPAAARKH
ncbi:sodium/glutamate symporter [Corynebacterium otitidis]|uniref:Sodium/glutamate symporter n=1 Tax=Corynebacterium otitidis ATCC 51513 TaxID=883169 RepID=K0YEE4_9CORY|nr:hypothetical protein [Corynebacterium otitidis]EJZ81666.1 hypothetical protein HMPREF9719_01397 [Corynebacterium otitidis ATCC 51513]